jgi:ribA/ribD-fused uncharacterized protein
MINKFEGKYAFLSNFYNSPFTYDGIEYPTVEHFFQAAKTTDIAKRREIAAAPTPGLAKRMGRHVALRSDWEEVKNAVMALGLQFKFTDATLAEKLLATGDEDLIEGNWWHDNYWGACTCEKCINTLSRNKLGTLLMELRADLRKGSCQKKWYVFNDLNQPLCWDDQALEFDEEQQAERFLQAYCDEMGASYAEYCKAFGIHIKHCIFYYDGGHLDCSHKIISYSDDQEGQLIDIE